MDVADRGIAQNDSRSSFAERVLCRGVLGKLVRRFDRRVFRSRWTVRRSRGRLAVPCKSGNDVDQPYLGWNGRNKDRIIPHQ